MVREKEMEHPRNKYWRKYWNDNILHKMEIQRKYLSNPEVLERKRKYNQMWRLRNKERIRKKLLENREKYPGKFRARQKLKDALKSGKLRSKPCENCGVESTDGHHIDYRKPLTVRWLCKKHHMREHRKHKTVL